jgi:hypothetical protein
MTYEKITPGTKAIVKRAYYLLFHGLVKIDEHIATENQMRSPHGSELNPIREIDRIEGDQSFDNILDPVSPPLHQFEILFFDMFGSGSERIGYVLPPAGTDKNLL